MFAEYRVPPLSGGPTTRGRCELPCFEDVRRAGFRDSAARITDITLRQRTAIIARAATASLEERLDVGPGGVTQSWVQVVNNDLNSQTMM